MKNSNLLSREEMKALVGGQSAMGICTGQNGYGATCPLWTNDCQRLACIIGGVPANTAGVCCDGEPIWGMIDYICFEAMCVEWNP